MLFVIEPQPLATLCDRGNMLPDYILFQDRLRSVVIDFFGFIPTMLDKEEWVKYSQEIDRIGIDNFGSVGTRLLLDWMGVPNVPVEFCQLALEDGRIPRIGRLTGILDRGKGVAWLRTRVVSFVDYDL